MPPFERIHAAASRAHGVLTRARLLELGVPDREIRRWCARGRLRRVERGVYLVMGAPETWEVRVLARCLAHGGAASHRTAAALHAVGGFPRTTPEIVTPHTARAVADPFVRRARNWSTLGIRPVAGIPTVGAAPLSLQLASLVPVHLSTGRFELAVEHLVRAGRTSWSDLASVLVDARGHAGAGNLRRLVEEYADGCESRLERMFLELVRRHGLPMPVCQHRVILSTGAIVRLDFAYPPEKVAVEADSIEFHSSARAVVDDREKRRILRSDGWQVDEVTKWSLQHRGEQIAADLRASLARRRPPPR